MSEATVTDTDIDGGRPVAKLVVVTPETAFRWLQRNKSNRNIRPGHVAALGADMVAGNWQITGEGVKFDVHGNLLDGQHRLTAIVESGVTVSMLVVTGLQSESQQVMDSGAKRTAADALALSGHGRAAILAAAARLAIAQESGSFTNVNSQPPQVTHSQVVQFVDLNPDINDAAALVNGWRLIGSSMGAATAAALRLRRIDLDMAELFFEDVLALRTSGRGDPRAALIHRFQTAKSRRESISRTTEMWCIYRAWNAVRAGETLKILKFSPSTTWVEPS